ncbi:MAG TPA: UvrD-helicase domain-containing protein [Verrucomicrobiae bacterium]|nr:UvrD-helicase domain-containing protein [Verrucomicrobiae bacterium]
MLNLSVLNPQQREAVETLKGPVLILAGAGTGKTRVITYRIAHLIAKGAAPENILAVTFTNKAAREMQERIRKLIPATHKKAGSTEHRPTICTFHSLCVRILRRHIEKLGYKSSFVIYDETEQLSVVKKILSQISAKGEKTDPGAVLSLLSRFKNGGSNAAAFGDESVRALAQHIRSRYDSALHACNAVDFDDLILLTLRLFSEHPEALESCRAQYRYIMADEYQDTNAAQFQLIHALAANHRNFCVVGDDDQSIYGWRGAEIGNLLDLEKHFPEVKVIKLEQNYRSTNTILSAANAIIKNNPRRRAKQLWSGKGPGSKIILRSYPTDEDEARSVVEQIEFARMAHRVPWADNAILFRTNLQSRPLETALRKAGVRCHLIGGQSFFDRREVKDFIAYVKMFLHPHDDVSLLRIANVPARGLSDVTMERLLAASHERKSSVYAAMKSPVVQSAFQSKTRESIEHFVEFIERTAAELNQVTDSPKPLQSWSERFLNEIGYFGELRRGEKDADAAENRIRNLREMIATLDDFGQPNTPANARIQTFLEDITLDAERLEEKEEAGDAVTLITMHSCKGLEFPRVYIVGLEEGLLPHSRSAAEGTLDEERRLFYVGVTRAMQSLAISHCGGRKKYGQLMPCHPSRFLKELPPELVEDPEANKTPPNSDTAKKMFDLMRNLAAGDVEPLKS